MLLTVLPQPQAFVHCARIEAEVEKIVSALGSFVSLALVCWGVIFEFFLFISASNSSIRSDVTGGCPAWQCASSPTVYAVILRCLAADLMVRHSAGVCPGRGRTQRPSTAVCYDSPVFDVAASAARWCTASRVRTDNRAASCSCGSAASHGNNGMTNLGISEYSDENKVMPWSASSSSEQT